MITDGAAVTAVAGLLADVAATVDVRDDDGRRLPVVVFDGPAMAADYAPLWLAAGTPWQEDQESVMVTEELLGAGRRRRVTHAVACTALASGGELNFPEWRRQAGLLIAAVADALAADRTLGGTVAQARLGPDRQLRQAVDEQGAAIMVGFTVELVAL